MVYASGRSRRQVIRAFDLIASSISTYGYAPTRGTPGAGKYSIRWPVIHPARLYADLVALGGRGRDAARHVADEFRLVELPDD
jgi:hypothetical protein